MIDTADYPELSIGIVLLETMYQDNYIVSPRPVEYRVERLKPETMKECANVTIFKRRSV